MNTVHDLFAELQARANRSPQHQLPPQFYVDGAEMAAAHREADEPEAYRDEWHGGDAAFRESFKVHGREE